MQDYQLPEIQTTHVLQHYKNHCEYLGYIVEEDKEFSILCNHPRKEQLRLVQLNNRAGILAQIVNNLPEFLHNDHVSLYMYANDLNCALTFIKVCVFTYDDAPPLLVLTSVYEGEYNRQEFSTFLDNIQDDIQVYYSHPKTKDMWREQNSINQKS